MNATDYQSSPHAISYEQASAIERQAAAQLATTSHNLGPVDITHDAPLDELPD